MRVTGTCRVDVNTRERVASRNRKGKNFLFYSFGKLPVVVREKEKYII